ncbi:uncharacterized protein B0I36DRAFT_146421 [Microdochium trichocladiopsis]|uniref:Uncharacterized protein n=1 Tax=Microdochium trichocladiopsis TaxID=1682393 RepID=A0A9P8Y376_9PEZI|nr:uncharacterized protein B0I36DRAFT_146421 [Microdochium trichocladiopsis]KAH7028024.1 hypothetical protein B0I36DRAFT_146421 [Microdochium trichocladiopsis]
MPLGGMQFMTQSSGRQSPTSKIALENSPWKRPPKRWPRTWLEIAVLELWTSRVSLTCSNTPSLAAFRNFGCYTLEGSSLLELLGLFEFANEREGRDWLAQLRRQWAHPCRSGPGARLSLPHRRLGFTPQAINAVSVLAAAILQAPPSKLTAYA